MLLEQIPGWKAKKLPRGGASCLGNSALIPADPCLLGRVSPLVGSADRLVERIGVEDDPTVYGPNGPNHFILLLLALLLGTPWLVEPARRVD